jgi:hypothetical protein
MDLSQDFSKSLVLLGLQNSGGKVGTPIRLMTKLIGLRRIRANVTVPFKLEFAKILSRGEFIFGRSRAAPSPK